MDRCPWSPPDSPDSVDTPAWHTRGGLIFVWNLIYCRTSISRQTSRVLELYWIGRWYVDYGTNARATRWLITTDVTVLWQLAGAIKPQRLPRRPRAEFRELARQHRGFRSTGSWILATDIIAIFTGFGSTIFYEESCARAVWGLRNINTRNWIRNFIDLQQQKGGCGWVTWVLSR